MRAKAIESQETRAAGAHRAFVTIQCRRTPLRYTRIDGGQSRAYGGSRRRYRAAARGAGVSAMVHAREAVDQRDSSGAVPDSGAHVSRAAASRMDGGAVPRIRMEVADRSRGQRGGVPERKVS